MSHYPPITLRAVDDKAQLIFEYRVPFEFGVSVRQLLERAFVLAQAVEDKADPFLYTIEYYGYSRSAQYPGYLGYEIESVASFASDATHYWDLQLDGVTTMTGADTTFPNPGGTVLWQYQDVATAKNLPARTQEIHSRRRSRLQGK